MKPTTRTLLPLAGAALAYSLAQTMVIPALPELQQEFHAGPADATWLLTAFLLTSSVATPLLGRLGDMHGKERWLLISLAIFGVGSLIAAGSAHNRVATVLGFLAVVCATSNIIGGFLITDRMLRMFRRDVPAAKREGAAGAPPAGR